MVLTMLNKFDGKIFKEASNEIKLIENVSVVKGLWVKKW